MKRNHFFLIAFFLIAQFLTQFGVVSTCYAGDESIAKLNLDLISASNPIEIEADEVEYIAESADIVAKGNVIITFAGNALKTQEVIYNRTTGLITAPTLVMIEDSERNIYNASSGTIYVSWDNSEIDDVIAVFAQKGEVHASKVMFISRNITEANDVKYTLCDVCDHSFDMNNPPLWSLHATNFRRDAENELITVKNSILKTVGVPIFYFPYLSFPSPGAKSKSGLLTPIIRWERDFGINIKIPIYFTLAPNADFTITPWVMEHFGDQLSLNFRQLTQNGYHNITLSGAKTSTLDENGNLNRDIIRTRSHINAFGNIDLGSMRGKVKYKVFRLNDDLKTYLKKYNISNDDVLTSNISYEYFKHNEYTTIEAIQFQGLRSFDRLRITPQTYPKIQYYKIYDIKDKLFASYMADALNLYRSQGRNLQRAVMEGKLEGARSGSKYNFDYFVSLRGDYYYSHVRNPYSNAITEYNDFRGLETETNTIEEYRFFGALGGKISIPLYAKYHDKKFLLQPTISAIISPTLAEDKQFVNEDSQSPELRIENLFLPNIYKGKDEIQDGSRVMYSLKSLYKQGNYKFFLELGQLYNFHRNNNFDEQSGLIDCYSDLVSIFSLKYSDSISLSNKLRVDKSNFNVENNETSLHINYDKLDLNIDFYGLGKKSVAGTDLTFRNEVYTQMKWELKKDWSLKYANRSRVGAMQEGEKKLIAHEAGLVYKGKCLEVLLSVKRHNTSLNDYTPSTNYSLRVNVPFS